MRMQLNVLLAAALMLALAASPGLAGGSGGNQDGNGQGGNGQGGNGQGGNGQGGNGQGGNGQGAPGPIAGAGLGYLALAGGYYLYRRWREQNTEEYPSLFAESRVMPFQTPQRRESGNLGLAKSSTRRHEHACWNMSALSPWREDENHLLND